MSPHVRPVCVRARADEGAELGPAGQPHTRPGMSPHLAPPCQAVLPAGSPRLTVASRVEDSCLVLTVFAGNVCLSVSRPCLL